MNDPAPPTLRRRWYQFGLRTLLVFVVVSSIGLGWSGWKLQQARSHRAAVAELRQLACTIKFDERGWATAVDFPNSEIPDTDFPNSEIGEPDVSHSKVEVAPVRDADLVHLKALPKLEDLNLKQVHITNAGLAHLRELKNLRTLNLHAGFDTIANIIYPNITDDGLKHLETLTNLEELNLTNSPITDIGLKHLSGLTNLRKLSIENQRVPSYNAIRVIEDGFLVLKPVTDLPPGGSYQFEEITSLEKVTGAGLIHLSAMTKLESLNLCGLQVYNAGLGYLKAMTELRDLDLSNTQVVDSGLVHLLSMTKLEELDLSNTQVTDTGLEHLKGLKNLQVLGISNTKVTDRGVAELQAALPNCKIKWPNDLASRRITHFQEANAVPANSDHVFRRALAYVLGRFVLL